MLFQASKVKTNQLIKAEDFVVKNLGKILRNDENAYSSLFRLKSADALKTFRFNGSPYFVVLEDGKLISQYSLSTGENLLISILHSMQHQLPKSKTSGYYLFLLDEVELALHPSALVRLIDFLKGMSKEKGFSIYFSTHSIELLRLLFMAVESDDIPENKRGAYNAVSPSVKSLLETLFSNDK